MPNIVHDIIRNKDLSRAGDLFSIENEILLENFPQTIEIIKNSLNSREYLSQLNEQSIIEIVLTRCMSALRYFI